MLRCRPALWSLLATCLGSSNHETDLVSASPLVNITSIADMPTTLTCQLAYFRKSGKFYDVGSFEIPDTLALYEILEVVRAKRDEGRLPGLVNGGGREYMVLVNVPGHRHEHPYLIV